MEYENLDKVQKLCKEIDKKQEFVNGLKGNFVTITIHNNRTYLDEIPVNESLPHEYQKTAISFVCNLTEKLESDIRQLKRELSKL